MARLEVYATRLLRLSLAAAFALATGCTQAPPVQTTPCATSLCPDVHDASPGPGPALACSVNGTVGPPTYAVEDIGKAGVPKLSAADAKLVDATRKASASTTLRFVMIGGKMALFDGTDKPCSSFVPFPIVGMCNVQYDMVNAPDKLEPVPGAKPCKPVKKAKTKGKKPAKGAKPQKPAA